MAFVLKFFCFFVAAVICFQLNNAQSVPDRCLCVKTTQKKYTLEHIEEFTVTPPRHRCNVYEIIVTLKDVDTAGEKMKRCLEPKRKVGQHLLNCWAKTTEENRKGPVKASECLQNKN